MQKRSNHYLLIYYCSLRSIVSVCLANGVVVVTATFRLRAWANVDEHTIAWLAVRSRNVAVTTTAYDSIRETNGYDVYCLVFCTHVYECLSGPIDLGVCLFISLSFIPNTNPDPKPNNSTTPTPSQFTWPRQGWRQILTPFRRERKRDSTSERVFYLRSDVTPYFNG